MTNDGDQNYFLTIRTDGLGERLRALINAIILAEHFGTDFKFMWPERTLKAQAHHAVLSAEETFDPAFLADHLVSDIDTARLPSLDGVLRTAENIRDLLASPMKGIIVSQYPLNLVFDCPELGKRPGIHAAAFSRIRFSSKARAAVDAAMSVDLPQTNVVAVHLRAGDVIYGDFRYSSGMSGKTVCYPVAKRLIGQLIAQHKYPLIFGQDDVICRMLADRFSLKLGAEFTTQDDALCAALSEIALMSRCDEIYAGRSGFSILASMTGAKVRKAHSAGWSSQEIIDCIVGDDELDDPTSPLPSLQRAFAFYSVAYNADATTPNHTIATALGRALHYDPINAFYALNRARLQIADGDLDGAETTLKLAVVSDSGPSPAKSTLYSVLKRAIAAGRPEDRLGLSACIDAVTPHAGRRRPYMTYVLALWLCLAGDAALARRMTIRALAIEPDQPMFKQLLRMCKPVGHVDNSPAPELAAPTEGYPQWPYPPLRRIETKDFNLRRFSLTIYEALRKLWP